MAVAESDPSHAFVWVWRPGATAPVVAGRVDLLHGQLVFTYGRSYLARADAVPLYEPELPLGTSPIRPDPGRESAGCIRDAAPDAWGQRVILAHKFGRLTPAIDTGDLTLLTYLLESQSDRIGALDFQASATEYVPRQSGGTLEEMQRAADLLQAGEPLSDELDRALLHGTSIGGARPKVLLPDGDRRLIAKLSSTGDLYPVVKAEAVAMDLARRVGVTVPRTELVRCLDRDVLLVERFDRTAVPGQRRLMVSALTVLGLTEMTGRHATYPDLADEVRRRFTDPTQTLHELFRRIVFNVCVGNIDDHARNHAAFWDGSALTLTPAYDLCPQPRSGGEAAQAMAIDRNGQRRSRLAVCRDAAEIYHLDRRDAEDLIEQQVSTITTEWDEAADVARLAAAERALLWRRQILNAFIHEAG